MCVMNVRSVIRLRRVSSYSASICGVVSTTRQPGNWSTPLLPGAQPTPCFQSSTSPVGLAVRNLFSRMQPPRPLLENSTPVLSTTVGLPATRSLTLISATVESKRRDGLWGDSLQQSGPTNWNHPLGRMSTVRRNHSLRTLTVKSHWRSAEFIMIVDLRWLLFRPLFGQWNLSSIDCFGNIN